MHAYRFRRLSRLARRSDPHNSCIKVSKFMRKDICVDNNDDKSSQCSVVHIIVVRSGGHRLIRCGRNAFSFLFLFRLASFPSILLRQFHSGNQFVFVASGVSHRLLLILSSHTHRCNTLLSPIKLLLIVWAIQRGFTFENDTSTAIQSDNICVIGLFAAE